MDREMEALRVEGTDPESHRNTAKRDLGLIARLLLFSTIITCTQS